MQFALVHCQQLYQSKHWALQCTLSSSLDALMHCTLVLEPTDVSLVWFGLVHWSEPCAIRIVIVHIGKWCTTSLGLVWIGFCILDFAVLEFFLGGLVQCTLALVQCTLAVTYGSSLNIAPWPHCTIPLFITTITITIITIITISLFITITIKMNRPVLLEDFQASAGWVQALGRLSLVLWDPRPLILIFTSLPVERFWANL